MNAAFVEKKDSPVVVGKKVGQKRGRENLPGRNQHSISQDKGTKRTSPGERS